MDFDHLLDQAIEMLQRRGRLTYRTLKRQFELDDQVLEELKEELLFSQPVPIPLLRPRLAKNAHNKTRNPTGPHQRH